MPNAASDYPTRPVTLVVGFAPGGPSDVIARVVSRKLEQALGQPVIVDNRGGAGGNIAAEYVAGARADGYTLLLGTNGVLAANASLYRKLNYKPEDFVPISLVGVQPNVLIVHTAVPAATMQELIALAEALPGKLNFASGGHGTAGHLAGELFKSEAKVDIVHVAYKGTGPAVQDVVAGHVQMMFSAAAPVVPLIREKQAAGACRHHAQAHREPAGHRHGFGASFLFEATTWRALGRVTGTGRGRTLGVREAMMDTLKAPATSQRLTCSPRHDARRHHVSLLRSRRKIPHRRVYQGVQFNWNDGRAQGQRPMMLPPNRPSTSPTFPTPSVGARRSRHGVPPVRATLRRRHLRSLRHAGARRGHQFLVARHELLWTKVTASNLVKVDMRDDLDEFRRCRPPGFTLHGGVLTGRPNVNCSVHVHTETGMALAGLKHGLRMVSQQAMRFHNRIGYHPYEGITEDFGERACPGAQQRPRADPQRSQPASPSARMRARRSC